MCVCVVRACHVCLRPGIFSTIAVLVQCSFRNKKKKDFFSRRCRATAKVATPDLGRHPIQVACYGASDRKEGCAESDRDESDEGSESDEGIR